jgi:hypothetical protein
MLNLIMFLETYLLPPLDSEFPLDEPPEPPEFLGSDERCGAETDGLLCEEFCLGELISLLGAEVLTELLDSELLV